MRIFTDVDAETNEEEKAFVAHIQQASPADALHLLRVAIINAAVQGAGDFMLWQQDPDTRSDVDVHPDAKAYLSQHARLGYCADWQPTVER